MTEQQTRGSGTAGARLLLRVVVGVLLASFAGAIWIVLTATFGLISDRELTVDAIAGGTLVYFVIILIVFVVFGLPAYFLVRYFRLREVIPGIIYGFMLGMFVSWGMGAQYAGHLALLIAAFGFAGVISAGTFLFVMRSRRQAQNV